MDYFEVDYCFFIFNWEGENVYFFFQCFFDCFFLVVFYLEFFVLGGVEFFFVYLFFVFYFNVVVFVVEEFFYLGQKFDGKCFFVGVVEVFGFFLFFVVFFVGEQVVDFEVDVWVGFFYVYQC